jgi:hypothetical protein
MKQERVDLLIKFDKPIPCANLNGAGICGNPATVAVVWPLGIHWAMHPICEDCTRASARTYAVVSPAGELYLEEGFSTHDGE